MSLVNSNPIVYNVFQIESLKRLSLLKYIVQDKFREVINKILKDNEEILKANQLDCYSVISNFSEKVFFYFYLIINIPFFIHFCLFFIKKNNLAFFLECSENIYSSI
jgi:hypothetical protein